MTRAEPKAVSNGKKTEPRLRMVGWNVQPVIMSDDGDNLTPVPVGATLIPNAEWENFKAGGDETALEQLRQQFHEQLEAERT